jgi:hypothetical protein
LSCPFSAYHNSLRRRFDRVTELVPVGRRAQDLAGRRSSSPSSSRIAASVVVERPCT